MKLKTIVLTMCLIIMAAYNAHAQTQTGYRIPPRLDIGGGRTTGDMWMQAGTNGVRLIIGTQTVTQVGTTGVITGTTATLLPRVDFTTDGGSTSVNFNGFNQVAVAGAAIPSAGSVTGKLDAVGGVGTNNTFNNATLAGVGTITATFRVNGVDISPAEMSNIDTTSSNIQTQLDTKLNKVNGVNTYIGSVTAGGKTGTTSVAHNAGSNMIITSTVTAEGGLSITYDASGTLTSSFANLTGSPFDNGTLTPYISFTRSGTNIAPGTITDSVTFGTTTQRNDSEVTIYGSGTSPLSVFVNRNYIGTNTTSIMTGTSTPVGEVLVSSTYSGSYPGYEAFDGIISGSAGNGWSATGATNESITYNYGTGAAHGIKQYRITANITDIGGANNAPNTFDFRGSNDNVTYTSIHAMSGEGTWTALETKTYTIATSTTQYQFYRLHIASVNGGTNTTIGELQLIGEAGLFDSIYVTGSGTVHIGTTTPSSTSTTYLFQVAGGLLGTNLGVTCYGAIKDIIGSGSGVIEESHNAVMETKLFKHHPRIGDNIDTSVTSITPVSDDPSTPDLFKRGDKRILDLQPQIGALMGTAQYQDAEIKELRAIIGSLTSRINKAGIQ